MPTRNVVLTDHQTRFVNRMVGSGRYQNASEVLREGLRLMEHREAEAAARLEALRNAGIADIDAGKYRASDTARSMRSHFDTVVAADLVGTWRLVSWENVSPDGVSHPMGPDALGYLSYNRRGRVFVQVMRRQRGDLTDNDVDVAAASADQLRDVLGGYLAYAGGYQVDSAAGTVTHRIECGLLPAQVGTELTRWIELDGSRLTLHLTPPAATAPGSGSRVAWERIE